MLGEPLKSIRVESISRVDDRALMGHFLVTFKLVGLSPEVTIPVSVSSLHFKEDDVIRIARHHLSQLAKQLVTASHDWEMADDDLRKLWARHAS